MVMRQSPVVVIPDVINPVSSFLQMPTRSVLHEFCEIETKIVHSNKRFANIQIQER